MLTKEDIIIMANDSGLGDIFRDEAPLSKNYQCRYDQPQEVLDRLWKRIDELEDEREGWRKAYMMLLKMLD